MSGVLEALRGTVLVCAGAMGSIPDGSNGASFTRLEGASLRMAAETCKTDFESCDP